MLLEARHALLLEQHLRRHVAENGLDGRYFLGPQSLDAVLATYDALSWDWPVRAGGWQRVWGWCDEDGDLRAHVVLSGNAMAPWRVTSAVGVEAFWRRHGHGRKLMEAALSWAVEQPGLDWVDAWTFGANLAARQLHKRLGFAEVGRVPDVARIGEQSLDQVLLLIDLRRPQGGTSWH